MNSSTKAMLKAALQRSFVQDTLAVAHAVLQEQLNQVGMQPAGQPAQVYDSMLDSVALRWGCEYRDPASGVRLMAYASPSVMGFGEHEGKVSLSVWFALMPSGYAGRPMDFLANGVACEQLLACDPGAKLVSHEIDPDEWNESAWAGLGRDMAACKAQMSSISRQAVNQLAEALQP